MPTTDGVSCCWFPSSWSTLPCRHHPVTTTWPVHQFVRPIGPEDCQTETCHNPIYPSQQVNQNLLSTNFVCVTLNIRSVILIDEWILSFICLLRNDKNWHFDARVFTYVVLSIVQTSPMLNASYQSHHHHFHYIIMWSRAYRECKATKKRNRQLKTKLVKGGTGSSGNPGAVEEETDCGCPLFKEEESLQPCVHMIRSTKILHILRAGYLISQFECRVPIEKTDE